MKKLYLLFLALFCGSVLLAQPSTPPCQSPEYRQMDFWIGDWEVFDPSGQLVGTNRIDQILGTCVLMENWVGKGGSVGHSFNIYNRQTQRWEQTWVDNSGAAIYFHGSWKEDHMDYRSESTARDGKPVLFQMTFTPQENGDVRQLWTASRDGGDSWNTLFDGTYRKKKTDE